VIIGPLTGHSTLKRHLYIIGLTGSALWRTFCAGEESSAHIMCHCRAIDTDRRSAAHIMCQCRTVETDRRFSAHIMCQCRAVDTDRRSSAHIMCQCRAVDTDRRSSAHIMCQCRAVDTDRRSHRCAFTYYSEYFRNLNLGAVRNFIRGTGPP